MRQQSTPCTCGHPGATHGPSCRVIGCTCTWWRPQQQQKRNKYGAVKTTARMYGLDVLYDSKAEREYAADLDDRMTMGAILRWAWAPRVVLQDDPSITYRPDMLVWPKGAGVDMYAVDVKSRATMSARDFSLRVRLWLARYPAVPLVVVSDGEERWL